MLFWGTRKPKQLLILGDFIFSLLSNSMWTSNCLVPTFFKISSFVFSTRKKWIQVCFGRVNSLICLIHVLFTCSVVTFTGRAAIWEALPPTGELRNSSIWNTELCKIMILYRLKYDTGNFTIPVYRTSLTHSRTCSLAKYTSFDSYAYTDIQCMRFTPNCNTSPGLAGPVGSSYEDYSVMKDTEEKLRSPVSTAERLTVTKYCCKLPFGKPDRV